MADPIDLSPPVTAIGLDPQEAIEFFRSKGYAPPESRFSYRDWFGASHARGFVVAKVMQDDLLATIREAVDDSLAKGLTLDNFNDTLIPKLKAAGWWGQQTMRDPITGETRTVQLGSKRRLAVIFDTNLRTSYAAGKWTRIQRTRDLLPYLLYTQLQRVTKREAHTRFHRLVLPADHPLWATHYPPNGYYCACTVRQMSKGMLDNEGIAVSAEPPIKYKTWTDPRTGRRLRVPEGITPGFDTNPGATFLADQGRHDRIAGDLTPEARGIELGLINEARSRGLRTGNEHLAAIDLDAANPVPGGNAAPAGWVSGTANSVEPGAAMKAAMIDPARRIGAVHNHPGSSGFSRADLLVLDGWKGLDRVIAVGHDGSLYRASAPRPGLGQVIEPLYEYSEGLVEAAAAGLGMDRAALFTLRGHATASALARTGYLDYAHAISGGSRINLMRFGEANMALIIERLVEWINNRYPNRTAP